MNGRVYDPVLGRFLTPDPLVQAPTLSQSWNRYSYVWNNPLRNTDPSGYKTESQTSGQYTQEVQRMGKDADVDQVIELPNATIKLYKNGDVGVIVKKGSENQGTKSDTAESAGNKINGWLRKGVSAAQSIAGSVSEVMDSAGQALNSDMASNLVRGQPLASALLSTAQGSVDSAATISSDISEGSYTSAAFGVALAFATRGKGNQMHHLIPKKVFKDFKHLLPKGYLRDHEKNLMSLTTPFHGNHPSYSNYVSNQIENLVSKGPLTMDKMVGLQKKMRAQLDDLQKSGTYERLNDFYKDLGF